MRRILTLCLLFAIFTTTAHSQPVMNQTQSPDQPQARRQEGAELFKLSDVRLLDGPFKDAMEVNRTYLLKLKPDRLLAPFLIDAGLKPKAEMYPNWESSGLGGHTAGHYLSALANMCAATDDKQCRQRLDYMVSELARCQEAHGNGYVGGVPNSKQLWDEVAAGNIRASGFGLNDRWVPWYNLHKTFAGLRDAYVVAGNEQAKRVLIKLADWCDRLVANLTDAQMQDMLRAESGGMNEVLADVAEITGKPKYLALARRFNHQAILQPLEHQQDKLNGLHANTQVPKVVGFQRIAALTGNRDYHRAAVFFWEQVTGHRTIAIGGNSISEHFPAPDQSIQWIESREGPETCNTYNMLRLTEQLFEAEPEGRYADFYERAMFNHILSTQDPEHGGYVYFTPARPRHYRVYSQPQQSFWCCVGTGMENHTKYGRFIYAHNDDSLYLNLFVASELTWKDKGLTLRQDTKFPDQPSTKLTFTLDKPVKLALRIRHPYWASDAGFTVSVNGEPQAVDSEPSSFVTIDREWHSGDVVEVALPMRLHTEPLPYLDQYVAVMDGPIVLAAPTGNEDMPDLFAGSGRMDHVAHGPLEPLDKAPMLVTEPGELTKLIKPVSGEPLTFTAPDAIEPDSFDKLELIPFFRLHEQRYMMYWRSVTPEQYTDALAQIAAAEQAKLRLDRATVDRVAPGEQQPETEHNFKGEQTETGIWQDRHFRHTRDWFSYDLKTNGKRGLALMVTYFGSDQREFDILVNGKLLESVSLKASKPGQFIDVRYPIPAEMVKQAKDGVLTVRFQAKPGSMAGGIFDVRLLHEVKTR